MVQLPKRKVVAAVVLFIVCIVVGLVLFTNSNTTVPAVKAQEKFTFEVSPYKKCLNTIYDLDPQSALYKKCHDPTMHSVVDNMGCPKFMVPGVKPRFQYTPLSNAKWENARCQNHSEVIHSGIEEMYDTLGTI